MKKLKEFTKFDAETTKKVETVRAAWGVQQSVRGEGLPRWVRTKKYEGFLDRQDILDHVGRIGETVVAEPYLGTHNPELIQDAIEHAEKYDLDLKISLMSWHYPGKTIRFEFTPKDLT
jgi:hypothetical protein